MSIDFTMPGDIPGFGDSNPTSFESQLSAILKKMLRTSYDYAVLTPEKLHLYVQIGDGSASAGCLFEVSGKLYDLNTLKNALSLSKFDASEENKMEFFQLLAMGIGDILSLFSGNDRALPNQIWSSIDVSTEDRATIVGYNASDTEGLRDVNVEVNEWKNRIEQQGSDLIGRLAITAAVGTLPGAL